LQFGEVRTKVKTTDDWKKPSDTLSQVALGAREILR